MLSDRTLEYAEDVTGALLGVDALCRTDDGEFDEGLVVVNMDPARVPEAFSSWDDVRARFDVLRERAAGLPEPDRRLYYTQLCQSTDAFARYHDGGLPFERQIAEFLHGAPAPASAGELDVRRTELRRELTAAGYTGGLTEQVSQWERSNVVPADEVEGTLTGLLDEAWDRTAERIEVPAPKTDGMRVATVRGVPF